MARVSADQPFASVEVDLWGEVYRTKNVVRSVARKLNALEEKLDTTGKDEDDLAIEYMAKMLDLKLEGPINDDGKVTGKTKPSTILKRKWQEDAVSVQQVFDLIVNIGSAEAEATGRPI